MHAVDYRVVGAGLTGAVIARTLADAGCSVSVVDRRTHVAGNVHDAMHHSGIRVHTYGPHYFRTSSDALWTWVQRFAEFYPFEAVLKARVGATLENWPVSAEYVARTVGPTWRPAFNGEPRNFEEASLAMMPRAIYDTFVREYTEKQWGVPATTLAAALAGRFDVRVDGDPRLKLSRFQGLPRGGYTQWVARMLDGLPVVLRCDYLRDGTSLPPAGFVIFTGPIDEFFAFRLGRLVYRGQRREHRHFDDAAPRQPVAQVNYPRHEQGPHIRTLEWRHLMEPTEAALSAGTVITTETPYTPDEPADFEYPFPDAINAELYRRYRELAHGRTDVLICGRLGEYRYFDMDQAIGRARMLAERLLAQRAERAALEARNASPAEFRRLQVSLIA